jgi:hypothetical protein
MLFDLKLLSEAVNPRNKPVPLPGSHGLPQHEIGKLQMTKQYFE